MIQPNLFDGPPLPAYQRHSETSKAAAVAIEPHLNALQSKVLAHLKAAKGCTDEAGIEATGLMGSTYRPRRIELLQCGLVRDSGRKGLLASGRQGVVWEAVEGK